MGSHGFVDNALAVLSIGVSATNPLALGLEMLRFSPHHRLRFHEMRFSNAIPDVATLLDAPADFAAAVRRYVTSHAFYDGLVFESSDTTLVTAADSPSIVAQTILRDHPARDQITEIRVSHNGERVQAHIIVASERAPRFEGVVSTDEAARRFAESQAFYDANPATYPKQMCAAGIPVSCLHLPSDGMMTLAEEEALETKTEFLLEMDKLGWFRIAASGRKPSKGQMETANSMAGDIRDLFPFDFDGGPDLPHDDTLADDVVLCISAGNADFVVPQSVQRGIAMALRGAVKDGMFDGLPQEFPLAESDWGEDSLPVDSDRFLSAWPEVIDVDARLWEVRRRVMAVLNDHMAEIRDFVSSQFNDAGPDIDVSEGDED